jgi:ribosomal protein S18 acetylase RimI-like enzyme
LPFFPEKTLPLARVCKAAAVRVRQAHPNDARTIAELNAIVQQLHFDERPDRFVAPDPDATKPHFRQRLARDDIRVFVAEDGDGTAIGYVVGVLQERPNSVLTANRRVVVLDEIAVRPDSRRTGIGDQLVKAVLDYAQEVRADSVESSVWEFNEGARAFFEGLNFLPVVQKMEFRLR